MERHPPSYRRTRRRSRARLDLLYWFRVAQTAFFVVAIGVVVVGPRGSFPRKCDDRKATQIEGSLVLELMWAGMPLVIVIALFAWGTTL